MVENAAPRKMAPVIDLMQALQKSLGELPKRKPAAQAGENREEAEAPVAGKAACEASARASSKCLRFSSLELCGQPRSIRG